MFGLSAQHTHVVPYEQVLNVSTVKRLVPVWISKRAGTFIASLMAVNGIVYVGSEDKNLYAYKTTGCGTEKQCQPLWYGSTGGMIDASAAVFSGKVYISSGDGKVYAYDSNTCKKLRSQSCLPIWFSVPTKYAITSSPTIANGVLYIGSLDNRLYTYDIKGCLSQKSPCTSLWHSQDLGSGCVANGMVYAATAEGHVYAFGLNHA